MEKNTAIISMKVRPTTKAKLDEIRQFYKEKIGVTPAYPDIIEALILYFETGKPTILGLYRAEMLDKLKWKEV